MIYEVSDRPVSQRPTNVLLEPAFKSKQTGYFRLSIRANIRLGMTREFALLTKQDVVLLVQHLIDVIGCD